MNKRMTFAVTALFAASAAYLLYRYFNGPKPAYLDASVGERLPISKDLPTVADAEANYDIDGVSFDEEGTIVGSDAVKPVESPLH